MNAQTPLTPDLEDFEALEAAVMSTERGRWFLAEHARRHRAADTAAVLEALDDLGRRVSGARPPAEPDPVVGRLAMAISKFAVRLALLRDDLEAHAPADRRVARALRRVAGLERLAGAAAAAAAEGLGAGPPRIGRPDRTEADPHDARAIDRPGPAEDVASAPADPPLGAAVAPPERPHPHGPARLPPAWTPELLLGLTDDDGPLRL